MEVYTTYGEMILPRLLEVLNASFKVSLLPTSMSRANVVLLLKPGRDPLDPSSYRPISLLQCDVNILDKVLALRVNTFILSIIHPDHAGFMPPKSTATNLRGLFLNMQTQADNLGQAFDSISWPYLWAVLSKFGFGAHFIAWVHLLYSSPQVAIRVSDRMSPAFALGRGTSQPVPSHPCSLP